MKHSPTKRISSLLFISCFATAMVNAQSQYEGTYYGELDEEVKNFGIVTQPREKTNDLTVTVDSAGNLTVTGISGVSGTVDSNGTVQFFENGFGFSTGTIVNRVLNANGSHEQNGGTRVNEYWIVATMNTPVSASFPDATQHPDNWNSTPWFGSFNGAGFPWIYHETLAWMYCQGSDDTTLWLYFAPLGWLATSETLYPWIYDQLMLTWLYYDTSTTNPQWFYNQNTNQWFSVNNE
ncbi:hypothetical protein [Rubellicoccus peritrichatus]|uniref:Secreted protein n=1 Tax=Rubellicoccus peritrichatus TaxID=3080537 RepID=A0AAQ3L9E9_9BACT|nr:hypothetical protein [Puniceicoccus sp. CR14]WOO39268.1 hypothetical protein RZN69_11650 [Puniceicoccus sp. CR14]